MVSITLASKLDVNPYHGKKKTSPNSLGVHVWGQQWEESLSWHWLTTQQWWLLSTRVPAKTLKATHLMRCLFFCLAQCGCTVKVAHIQGCRNVAVDGGMATTAAKVESKDSIIKTLGCWESTAYLQYMKIPRARLAGYTMQLAKESRAGQWAGRPQWRHPVRRLITLQTRTKFSVLAVVQSDTHLLSFMYSNILCFLLFFFSFFLTYM